MPSDRSRRGHVDPASHPSLRPLAAPARAAGQGLVPKPRKSPAVTSKPHRIRALTELQPRGSEDSSRTQNGSGMLVFCCMATARRNSKRVAKSAGTPRPAEGSGGRPVAGATSSYVNIIEALLENGSMSRSELATSIGLSRSALTEMSRVLIQHQFVEESRSVLDRQGRGRPSIMLSLNARDGYFWGGGVTEAPPLMALTDCHGNVLAEHEISAEMDPEAVASAIAQNLPHLTRASNISREKVLGIGVALSGHVNHADGICLHSNLLGWHNVPIAKIVERVTHMPTYIDNDAHAVALGQKLFGMAREN